MRRDVGRVWGCSSLDLGVYDEQGGMWSIRLLDAGEEQICSAKNVSPGRSPIVQ
jgi:hypothetical protein